MVDSKNAYELNGAWQILPSLEECIK